VRGALSLLLEQLEAEPDLARLCIVESPRAGPAVLERRRHVLDALAAAVDEGRSEARAGTELPPLTAQGVIGGVLSVIHTRLLDHRPSAGSGARVGSPSGGGDPQPLMELVGPLMAMIAHPYLGPTAARKELERPTPEAPRRAPSRPAADLFKELPIRFTYRTARVLSTIASEGGHGSFPSNRLIADSSGIADEGQMSRLLRRLQQCGLIDNHGDGHARGEPNAWALTERGAAIHAAIAASA
jgi:DNA-binding MarR family transcriptional regulator